MDIASWCSSTSLGIRWYRVTAHVGFWFPKIPTTSKDKHSVGRISFNVAGVKLNCARTARRVGPGASSGQIKASALLKMRRSFFKRDVDSPFLALGRARAFCLDRAPYGALPSSRSHKEVTVSLGTQSSTFGPRNCCLPSAIRPKFNVTSENNTLGKNIPTGLSRKFHFLFRVR